MIKEAIKKLVAGNDLTFDEAAQVMDEMFSGTATQSQMAASHSLENQGRNN